MDRQTELKSRWKYSVEKSRNCKFSLDFFASLSSTLFSLSLSIFLLFTSEYYDYTLLSLREGEREQENMPTGVTVFYIIVIFYLRKKRERRKKLGEKKKECNHEKNIYRINYGSNVSRYSDASLMFISFRNAVYSIDFFSLLLSE